MNSKGKKLKRKIRNLIRSGNNLIGAEKKYSEYYESLSENELYEIVNYKDEELNNLTIKLDKLRIDIEKFL